MFGSGRDHKKSKSVKGSKFIEMLCQSIRNKAYESVYLTFVPMPPIILTNNQSITLFNEERISYYYTLASFLLSFALPSLLSRSQQGQCFWNTSDEFVKELQCIG